MIRMNPTYQTPDGCRFENAADAIKHERLIALYDSLLGNPALRHESPENLALLASLAMIAFPDIRRVMTSEVPIGVSSSGIQELARATGMPESIAQEFARGGDPDEHKIEGEQHDPIPETAPLHSGGPISAGKGPFAVDSGLRNGATSEDAIKRVRDSIGRPTAGPFGAPSKPVDAADRKPIDPN